jgi:hypothetical protein
MSDSVFYYYAPEMAVILFLSLFIAGVICGYLMWATKRDDAIEIESETLELKASLQEMQSVQVKLEKQIRMTE